MDDLLENQNQLTNENSSTPQGTLRITVGETSEVAEAHRPDPATFNVKSKTRDGSWITNSWLLIIVIVVVVVLAALFMKSR
jgi:hypothetical protein